MSSLALRGLGIIIVLISHLPNSFLPTGGVNFFFLITGIVFLSKTNEYIFSIKEIKNFFKKRYLKIYPSIIFISILTIFFYIIFGKLDNPTLVINTFLATLIAYDNYFFLFNEINYFDEFNVNVFQHFWAFSIIFQFYVFVYFFGKFLAGNKSVLLITTIILTLYHLMSYFFNFTIIPENYINNLDLYYFYSLDQRLWIFFLGGVIARFDLSIINKFFFPVTIFCIFALMNFNNFIIINLIYILVFITFYNLQKNYFNLNKLLEFIGNYSYQIYCCFFPIYYFIDLYFLNFYFSLLAKILLITLFVKLLKYIK